MSARPLAEEQRGGKLPSPGLLQGALAEQRPPHNPFLGDEPLNPSAKHRRQRSIRRAKDSVEDLAAARARAELEEKRTSPDGGSLGREGRQFTVGSIGNNGRIYLRYGPLFPHC
jgi:hypothetical protein